MFFVFDVGWAGCCVWLLVSSSVGLIDLGSRRVCGCVVL